MKPLLKTRNNQRGFTLFELLIAVLVLAVGLLGLATMQAQGLKSNSSAEKRTEATFLAMDIMDRMRASPNNLDDYEVDAGVIGGCDGGCPAIVNQDLIEWTTAVKQQLGSGGDAWRAQIAQIGGVYMVTLMWDDERTGATGTDCSGNPNPPDLDMTCFQTLFQP
jgi:type IV pilus assembly protein PilV